MRAGLPQQKNYLSNLCVAVHWLKNNIDIKLFAENDNPRVAIDNDPHHGQ